MGKRPSRLRGADRMRIFLPAEPLRDLIYRRSLAARDYAADRNHQYVGPYDVNRKRLYLSGTVFKSLLDSEYVRWDVADRICILLGCHPIEVFGNEWTQAEEAM